MSNYIDKPIEELNEASVAPYGKMIAPNFGSEPDIKGDGWVCWYPLGQLNSDRILSIGMVLVQPKGKHFSKMEKHPNRSEWVFAVEKPYIQPVALSSVEDRNKPDHNSIKVFLIKPGQGILISADVWHAPGINYDDSPTLYGFVLGESYDDDVELGLVSFDEEVIVRCIL